LNGTITFFDAATLEPAGEPLTGATASAGSMQFIAEGRVLVTAGGATLRFWDVDGRQQLGPGIALNIGGVDVAPAGDEVAASTPAGVQRFTLDRSTLRQAACRIAGRELTADEWRRYLGGDLHPLCA
jgi:hypothetical protein